MRGAWERGLAKLELGDKLPGKTVDVVEGSFEDFGKSGVQKGTVDLVVIAQAWHWCPDHEAAFVSVRLGEVVGARRGPAMGSGGNLGECSGQATFRDGDGRVKPRQNGPRTRVQLPQKSTA